MITPIIFTDSDGNIHNCYQFLITEFLAAELLSEESSEEEIRIISDDFFSDRYSQHTPMIGLDGNLVIQKDTYHVYNQMARDLMDRVNNLPAYTVSLIAKQTYRQLLNTYTTEWHLGTWRKLIAQENISSQNLTEHAYWIIEHIGSNKYNSIKTNFDMTKQNKLFIFSKVHLLDKVLDHPSFPPEEMIKLCYNKDSMVRLTVAEHPRCPKEGKLAVALMDWKEEKS